jgi:hypothetical protein
LAKALKQQGSSLPEFSFTGFEDAGVVRSAAGALSGQWYIAPDYAPGFVASYGAAFPPDSFNGAGYGCGALGLLAQALSLGYKGDALAQ